MFSANHLFPYIPDAAYSRRVAYFSMEIAIDQPLKTYSGGLGYLAGSHMRSAYQLKQHLVGVSMLWKYGYYDQARNEDKTMRVDFIEKEYSFLTDTGIVFPLTIHESIVHVKAYCLRPEVFQTVPIFFLSTDIEENDYLSRTITHRLYDEHDSTRVAQSVVLGAGGAKLLDLLGLTPDVYHMNESHALPLCFYLYAKFKFAEEVKKRVVFTTHTPEMAGNEVRSLSLLKEMDFFHGLEDSVINKLAYPDTDVLNYTRTAMQFSKAINGVSALHGKVSREMWGDTSITHITNAQDRLYWQDEKLALAVEKDDDDLLVNRKKWLKKQLFKVVADQSGKLFNENVLTIVWARRFAGYKRADLLLADFERFMRLAENKELPVQFIWAGKPYPKDDEGIRIFNEIYFKTRHLPNCSILTGYELALSAQLKKGSDVWLNNPRMYREASGTSGMSAAMNASINVSIPDGWVPEFARHGENAYLIEPAEDSFSQEIKDHVENERLINLLEQEVLPDYYRNKAKWLQIIKTAMNEVAIPFDSCRMADEYYKKMYVS